MRAWWLCLVAACYAPHDDERCGITCDHAAGEVCPDGLVCREDGFCATDGDGQPCGETVELEIKTTGPGEVTGPGGLRCSGTCTVSVLKDIAQQLTATPAADGRLASWAVDTQPIDVCDGVGCTTDVTLTADAKLTATFEAAHALTVTFPSDGFGNVRLTGGALDFTCDAAGPGSVCERRFPPQTTVSVVATEEPPSKFRRFDNCSGNSMSTCTVTVDDDVAVSATFDVTKIDMLVVPSTMGTINYGNLKSCGLAHPSDCTLLLDPDGAGSTSLTGFSLGTNEFVRWIGCPTDPPVVCSGPFGEDSLVIALFQPQPIVTANLVGAGGSIVVTIQGMGAPSSCNDGMTCSYPRPTGTMFTLSVPLGAAQLVSWGNPVCPNAQISCTFLLDRSLTFTPSFVQIPVGDS